VIGYDTLNEPLPGYIGWRNLNAAGGVLLLGPSPTPFQGMLLGAGLPQEVRGRGLGAASIGRAGMRVLNEAKARAWRDGYDCVWRQNGVWDFDGAGRSRLLRPDHFCRVNGRPVDFGQDYYRPFANRFATAIREADPRALIFIEGEVGHPPPKWGPGDAGGVVFAPHWYDGFTLMTKRFSPLLAANMHARRPVLFPGAIRRSFAGQLADLKRGATRLGAAPTLLGEFGIPFDLDGKKAYRTGEREASLWDFGTQLKALDRSFQAIEANLLSCTLWNYTADNSNARGDGWNDEDLSIFSRDQRTDPGDINSGGRGLQAVVRPYPAATAGEPLRMWFDIRRRIVEFEFRHDPNVAAPTEIFVPNLQYPQGYMVEVSDGAVEIYSERQVLIYRHATEHREHTLRISPRRRA
jgi:hypothetical protein